MILSTTHDKSLALPQRHRQEGHAMAVIGWDAAVRQSDDLESVRAITHRAERFGPNGATRPTHGALFTMPLADFTRSFATIHIPERQAGKAAEMTRRANHKSGTPGRRKHFSRRSALNMTRTPLLAPRGLAPPARSSFFVLTPGP